MKVFALTVLLLSICCLEGAVVKRQAEETPVDEATTVTYTHITEFFQNLRRQAEQFSALVRDSFQGEGVQGIKAQAESILQQLQDTFVPLTEEMKQNVAQMFPASTGSN